MDETTRLYKADASELTTRQRFEKMLIERGMLYDQAHAVMDKAIPIIDEQSGDYEVTWERPSTEYPDAVYNVMFLTVKPIALEYIEQVCPNAWFKGMFA